MIVRVHLYSQSQPVEISSVRNTYTKDGLYCVMTTEADNLVYKFPLQHVFRITEFAA